MKEPGWVSVHMVAECSVLLARKKREESRDWGLWQEWAEKTSLRESFRHSKQGVRVIFPSPVQGPVSQANSSSDLPSCTHPFDGSRMRCSHLLGALCWLLSLTSAKSYSSCFRTKTGWHFYTCFTGPERGWMSRRAKFWFRALPFKGISWLFDKTTGSMGTGGTSSLDCSKLLIQ